MTRDDLERDIPQRLAELRADASEPAWDAMERRLLGAFAEQHARPATRRPRAAARITVPGATAMTWRLGAAAAVVLAAAITFYPRTEPRHVPATEAPDVPRETVKPTTTPPPPHQPSTTHVPAPAVRPAGSKPRATTAKAAVTARSPFADFVALPGASALPDFESGRIMRIEVPLTGLPAYGIDMVLDAMPGTVEADLLVGQDGVQRAIRLASSNSQLQE